MFFGTNIVVSRFAIGQMHPLVYVAVRMPMAAALALLWTWLRHRRFPRGRKLWVHGTVVGLLATAAPMVFFISGLQYQSSGVTSLIIMLTPIVAMFFSHFRLQDDRITVQKVAGAIVSFSGVGLLLATGETGLGEAHWEGFVLTLIGVPAAAYGIVHVRKYLSDQDPLEITAVRLSTAAVLVLPLGFIVDGFDLSRVQLGGGIAILYGAIAGGLLGFLLYSYVTARFGASKATQTEYLVPIVATVTGAIFLGEQVSFIVVAGMVIALGGIIIATWRSPKSRRSAAAAGPR